MREPAPYDEFSAEYAEHAATNPFNAFYDRPAILDLAGDVTGKRVIDVGCAAGHLTAELARRGAKVTGLDLSQGMIDVARRTFGELAEFRQADLGRPLDFFDDASVDLITASLVLHYLRDWGAPLAELRRVLRPGGVLVASVHHPEDWHWFDETHYFATELITDEWTVSGTARQVRFYRRPLGETFSALRRAGFQVDQLVEPMPLPDCAVENPRAYEILTSAPRFLYFRLLNPA